MNHPQIFNNCHLSSVIPESIKIAHLDVSDEK